MLGIEGVLRRRGGREGRTPSPCRAVSEHNVMTIEKALVQIQETMTAVATFESKDRGATTWTTDMHAGAAGLAMRRVFAPKSGVDGLEASSANYTTLFKALYNHSQWRQKFEKAKLFAPKSERTAKTVENEYEAELEGGE